MAQNFMIYLRKFLAKRKLMNIEYNKNDKKSIAEVLRSEDAVLIYCWDNKIADDGQDIKKVTASEALDNLGTVKCFAKTHGDMQMNVMPRYFICR